jgi:hypothetical protein
MDTSSIKFQSVFLVATLLMFCLIVTGIILVSIQAAADNECKAKTWEPASKARRRYVCRMRCSGVTTACVNACNYREK